MKYRRLIGVVVLMALAGACRGPQAGDLGQRDVPLSAQVRAILESAETLEVLRTHPQHIRQRGVAPAPDKTVFGYEITARTPATDPATKNRVVQALYDSLASDGAEPAKCFNPRHAIVATSGADTVTVVVCFECSSVRVYLNGTEEDGAPIGPEGQARLDALLPAKP